MTKDEKQWHEAAALSGNLLAALIFLGNHPEPCEQTRAEIRKIVAEACRRPPVHRAMVGFYVLVEKTRGTGWIYTPSRDGASELAAVHALVDAVSARIEAADARARGGTTH